jgi:hypothetical protein
MRLFAALWSTLPLPEGRLGAAEGAGAGLEVFTVAVTAGFLAVAGLATVVVFIMPPPAGTLLLAPRATPPTDGFATTDFIIPPVPAPAPAPGFGANAGLERTLPPKFHCFAVPLARMASRAPFMLVEGVGAGAAGRALGFFMNAAILGGMGVLAIVVDLL